MKIGIIISTYQREDGKTPVYLNRTLDSVLAQTYKNYKIFLIGDRYENNDEFESYVKKINHVEHYFENLPIAHERDVYGSNKNALWSYGGTNATNYAMDLCEKEGIDFVVTLNHDDWWYETHLEEFYNCYEMFKCDFMCTKSTFFNPNNFLPIVNSKEYYNSFFPSYGALIHSSAIINIKNIPLRYIDLFKTTGKVGLPGDGEYWNRATKFMRENKLCGIMINKLTCRHDEEGYVKR
jgi:glycosyltransferase involved in cell wall biosynthesis